MSILHSQRGWVGMIVMLVAVLIIAVLASTALKRYGLLQPGGDTATIHRAPTPAAENASDPVTSTPNYGAAIERARGVEATVQKQADDAKSKIDDATK